VVRDKQLDRKTLRGKIKAENEWSRRAGLNRETLAAGEIMTFNYGLPAELFTATRKGGPRRRTGYRRFATAAEAIRFAVEGFPAIRTLDAWMQVGDERFDSKEIHQLYERDGHPLPRRAD
jgi:hypothetical protein